MWSALLSLARAEPAALDLSLGLAHSELRDDHQSPLRYAGNRGALQVALGRVWDGATLRATLAAGVGEQFAAGYADRGPGPRSLLVADVGVLATARVARIGRTRVDLGGRLGNGIGYSEVAFHPWGLGQATASVVGRAHAPVGRGALEFGLAVPLLGLVTRHGWSLDPVVPGKGNFAAFYEVGTRFATLADLQRVDLTGAWTLPLGARGADFRISGEATWLRYPDPLPVRWFDTRLLAGVSLPLSLSRSSG